MLTKNLLDVLAENAEKELVFEYQQNQFVPEAYHITEVKNVHIQSVDCGGRPSEEFQTIVQLWVAEDEQKERCMEAGKALKIFNIVDEIKPIRHNTEIFFEWGNENLPTSNYAVQDIELSNNKIFVKMFVPATACKPRLELIAEGKAVGCC